MSGKQGSLISMPMVEAFMMPSYDHGIPVISVDSDGNTDVRFRTEHPGVSVWGGLDKRALELDRAQELFALGGYIVGGIWLTKSYRRTRLVA